MGFNTAYKKPLSAGQLMALRILCRYRDRPVTNGKTTEDAINQETAWSLEERQLAETEYQHRGGGERVKILPQTKQLLKASL